MTDYGPDDDWPQHQRKEAKRALAEVRAEGWSITTHSAHAFGTIRCALHDPPCEEKIFSTAGDKSGSATAYAIRNKLRQCRRPTAATRDASASEGPNPLTSLAQGERLAEATRRLRRSETLGRRSDEDLAKALLADGETADQLLAQAEASMSTSESESRAAWSDAQRFGLGEPWPPEKGAAEIEQAALTLLTLARAAISEVDDADFEARLDAAEAILDQPNT